MCDDHEDEADFFVVYIAEAHAEDGWRDPHNEKDDIHIRQHTSLEERRAAARRCATELELDVPMLLDDMSDAACKAFSAWPERIYIVGSDGRIAYRGGHGPYDFDPAEARGALEELLRRDEGTRASS